MTVSGAPVVAEVQGLPEMPVAGLRIRDLVGSGKRGVLAFNTNGMELHDIKVDAADGPAFLIRDSADLQLDHVETARPIAGMPVIRLDRVTRAQVRASRAWLGTDTFLSAAPGLLKSVVLDSNQLSAAKSPTAESAVDFWKAIDSPDRQ